MRLRRLIAAGSMALALALFAGTAQAGFTTGVQAGPFNSNTTTPGGPDNGQFQVLGVPAFTGGTVSFSGDLTRVTTGTFASEARFCLTSPAAIRYCSTNLTSTGSYTGTLSITNANVPFRTAAPTSPVGSIFSGTAFPAGDWTVGFYESFNDGGVGSAVDSTWANVNITVNDFVPPTPPANTIDLGTLGSNEGDMLMNLQTWAAPTVQWYKFTLANAIGGGNGLKLDTLGSALSATQFGVNDTHMALYNAAGNVVNMNDDHTSNAISWRESMLTYGNVGPAQAGASAATLAAGVYYVAVSPYQLVASGNFTASYTAQTPNAAQGDIKLSIGYVPEPGTMALLALAGVALIRRRA